MGIKETKRDHWLASMNLTEGDVMIDEHGSEFVIVEFESGTASDDDYYIGKSKTYIPEFIQSNYNR